MEPENISSDEMVMKLMRTHLLLQETKKVAQGNIGTSEKVCNDQGKGDGNCRFR